MKIELPQSPEVITSRDLKPKLFIRPHHVVKNPAIKDALLRRKAPEVLAYYQALGEFERRDAGDPSGYFTEIIGTTIDDRDIFQERLTKYFQSLRTIRNSHYIEVSLERDGICKSCIVGRHCTATNYTSSLRPRNIVEVEARHVTTIRTALEEEGYVENVDYANTTRNFPIYDLGGEFLNTPNPGILTTASFTGLIIRAGSLREIIDDLQTTRMAA